MFPLICKQKLIRKRENESKWVGCFVPIKLARARARKEFPKIASVTSTIAKLDRIQDGQERNIPFGRPQDTQPI